LFIASVCLVLSGCGLGLFKTDTEEETGLYARDCEDPALPQGFGEDLSFHGGCTDLVLFARNVDDTVQLFFRVNGIVATANAEDDVQVETYNLPASGLTLNVNVGLNLSDITCDDVMEGVVNVAGTYIATAGVAALVVEPGSVDTDEWSATGTASLELEGVEFVDGNNCTLELGGLSFDEIPVGWSPG
jgi:hypothetical protein